MQPPRSGRAVPQVLQPWKCRTSTRATLRVTPLKRVGLLSNRAGRLVDSTHETTHLIHSKNRPAKPQIETMRLLYHCLALTIVYVVDCKAARADPATPGPYDDADVRHELAPLRHRDLTTNSTKPATTASNPPPQSHPDSAPVDADVSETKGQVSEGQSSNAGAGGASSSAGGGGASSSSSSSSSSSTTSSSSNNEANADGDTNSSSEGSSGESGSDSDVNAAAASNERTPNASSGPRSSQSILGLLVAAVVLGVGLASVTFRKVQ